MISRTTPLLALAIIFALFSVPALSGDVPRQADLVGNTFVLRQVDGEALASGLAPEIEFGDGLNIRGRICNNFRTRGELLDGLLRVDGVAGTRMLCPDDRLSVLESRFFRLLENGLNLELDGDILHMRAIGAELVFERVHPMDAAADLLDGRKFTLRRVNGDDFAVERQPFIEFGRDMRITGRACNNFMGQGELRGGVLTVAEAASTMMLCADPKLNEYEADFHKLLRKGAKLEFDGETLILSGDGVKLEFTETSEDMDDQLTMK